MSQITKMLSADDVELIGSVAGQDFANEVIHRLIMEIIGSKGSEKRKKQVLVRLLKDLF